ncbi:nuclear transport factor 2 family protein [Cellvibrio polysaccharolyticus]|uniref:Nuclear transport factor 2 family protein n=1 Tax=Cellvibrio polysaccharolyticus TaxID=2082724 RepID=A0A928YV69_9GAMM|nr:nuclear transport factor 2 family protein [Cellvibrio polysaccharolyticus]MBE8718722.1 nuclear transport factor 2 family protein [Cellvibrio polysaccharolyticus]
MSPKELVTRFISLIRAQQFDQAKELLATDSFEYIGPNMRFTDPEDMLSYLFGMAGIQKDIAVRQITAEDNSVFAALDYKTYFEPIGDVRIAIWLMVKDDKIVKVEGFYNAAVVENMLNVDGQLPFMIP